MPAITGKEFYTISPTDDLWNLHLSLRERLPRTWPAFFARFGPLKRVQYEAVPVILDGRNVVICSPTGSGKTEAMVAPLVERWLTPDRNQVGVLYIVPTRALAEDILRRIEGPLGAMNLVAKVKHGERPNLPDDPVHLLITTPESLDSLLCRAPRRLTTVSAVILDEIHLLDGTYRGDQLRVLLRRLAASLPGAQNPQIILASATVSEPQSVGARYASGTIVITVEGSRPIHWRIVCSYEEVLGIIREQHYRKILAFCNSRKAVEQAVQELQVLWKPHPVLPHHASLSRQERSRAEELLQGDGPSICVATSTLEVGIDIGNIDLVVLLEPPASRATLLQRIGRGNRRTESIQAIALARSADEARYLDELFSWAQDGALDVSDYQPDLSVAIQQLLSMIFATRRGVPFRDLVDCLAPLCSDVPTIERLTRHLQKRGWVLERKGVWTPTEQLMTWAERGYVHSNIADTTDVRVIDASSGRELGHVSGDVDESFAFAHRVWTVLRRDNDAIYVGPGKAKARAASFSPRSGVGRYSAWLPDDLRRGR